MKRLLCTLYKPCYTVTFQFTKKELQQNVHVSARGGKQRNYSVTQQQLQRCSSIAVNLHHGSIVAKLHTRQCRRLRREHFCERSRRAEELCLCNSLVVPPSFAKSRLRESFFLISTRQAAGRPSMEVRSRSNE